MSCKCTWNSGLLLNLSWALHFHSLLHSSFPIVFFQAAAKAFLKAKKCPFRRENVTSVKGFCLKHKTPAWDSAVWCSLPFPILWDYQASCTACPRLSVVPVLLKSHACEVCGVFWEAQLPPCDHQVVLCAAPRAAGVSGWGLKSCFQMQEWGRGEKGTSCEPFSFPLAAAVLQRSSLFTAFCCCCVVIDGAWWSSDVISGLSTFNLGVQLGCLWGFGDREMAICGFSARSWQVCGIWVAKNHKKLLKPLSQSSFSEIEIRCLFSLGWFSHPE